MGRNSFYMTQGPGAVYIGVRIPYGDMFNRFESGLLVDSRFQCARADWDSAPQEATFAWPVPHSTADLVVTLAICMGCDRQSHVQDILITTWLVVSRRLLASIRQIKRIRKLEDRLNPSV